MTAPPQLNVAARLCLAGDLDETPIRPSSWFITHGLGKPAAGMFTEVAFADDVLGELVHATPAEVDRVLEQTVRLVAGQLYGTAWAFSYRPEQYADAIGRYSMRRREVVLVSALEVYR